MAKGEAYEGGCLYGAVRYRAIGSPLQVAHCHCESCRRSTGSMFATGVGFRVEDVAWTREDPRSYQSSDGFARLFCTRCGSSVAQHNQNTDRMWMLAGTLDHPEHVTPEFHMFTQHQVPWIELDDGLPRHGRFPPGAAGKRGGGEEP